MDAAHVDVRRQRTERELLVFDTELKDWLSRRRDDDPQKAYRSQLACLEFQLTEALKAIRGQVPRVPEDASSENRARAIRKHRDIEQDMIWLRRTWHFFRDMFDQRDDNDLRPLLQAADEVVWSCWEPLYEALPKLTRRPPPLPCIYQALSPAAIPPGLWPAELNLRNELEFLREHIESLPVPIVRLPDICVREPWWLALVAHEVGHHVQFALQPNKGMVRAFAELVRSTLLDAPADVPKTHADDWRGWATEVFADLFSIASVGPQALWAIAEFERGGSDFMVKMLTRYPPRIIRLELMAEAWRVVCRYDGIAVDDSALKRCFQGVDPTRFTSPQISELRKQVPPIAALVTQPLPSEASSILTIAQGRQRGRSEGTTKHLIKRSAEWRKKLTGALPGDAAPDGTRKVWAARTAAAALAAAWSKLRPSEDEHRLSTLREHGLTLLGSCRPDGDRKGTPEIAPAETPSLADVLFARPNRGGA